jgi:t-SNARE complex subunit (syntaxin)
VNQIFKELGTMIHEQGEVVDSIEASIEKTEVFVNEGASQLRQASTYQVAILYSLHVCKVWDFFCLLNPTIFHCVICSDM